MTALTKLQMHHGEDTAKRAPRLGDLCGLRCNSLQELKLELGQVRIEFYPCT